MIGAIFATDENGGFGMENKLPWPRVQRDMDHFKDITLNQTIVMGKNTWHSFNKPLPNRNHVVLSNSLAGFVFPQDAYAPTIYKSKEDILKNYEDFWVIGGPKLIDLFSDSYDVIYHTVISGVYLSTVKYFPKFLEKYNYRSSIFNEGCEIRKYVKYESKL